MYNSVEGMCSAGFVTLLTAGMLEGVGNDQYPWKPPQEATPPATDHGHSGQMGQRVTADPPRLEKDHREGNLGDQISENRFGFHPSSTGAVNTYTRQESLRNLTH